MVSWTSQLTTWSAECSLNGPASEAQLAESVLGQRLPEDLAALLRESNGIDDQYGIAVVWPVQRIITDNLHLRTNPDFADLYMPFEPLLFFGDAGNGDQFAFVMRNRPADVFVWDHETDSRTMIAPHLTGFLQEWLTGRITV